MSSIDRRVVEMEFDNKQFERGVKETLDSLEALKKGLTLEDAAKGLHNLEDAGKRFSLAGMADGIDNISSKFSVLGAVGFTIIQELTRSAMDYAKKLSGLVLDPLIQGGKRRALNIEQAKFQFRGLGMDVEETMASALAAVTGTAYGLDEAAKVAGQLGASGMRAGDDMTSSLRAISGVAAMTSSSYEDIGNIFTKVAGNGRVMGDDLLRMSSRGLNAAATLADSLGITEAEVRQLVTEGQVSFEMFYRAMDDAFGENATKANETYTGSLANMRAALSRIGANFFTPFLEQQRDLFNALSPAIDSVGNALKPVIDMMVGFSGAGTNRLIDNINSIDFSKLPLVIGPAVRIVENIIEALGSIIRPIREAFREIFPKSSIMDIRRFLQVIEDFTDRIKMGEDTADKFRRTFAGVFAVLGIGWEIVKAGAIFFADLFGIMFTGSGQFLDATANVGDFLVALHEAVKNGEGLTKFFEGLTEVLRGPIKFVKELGSAFLSIFDFDAPSADRISDVFAGLEPLSALGDLLVLGWDKLADSLKRVWESFRPLAEFMAPFFAEIQNAVSAIFEDLDFDRAIQIIQTGLLGGLLTTFNRFTKNLGSGMGSAIHRLTAPFGQLTFALQTMQTTLRALTLVQIAIAIGILAMSVLALSKVDAGGLAKAMTAISGMMAQLVGTMYLFQAIGGAKGMISAATGLILFAVALRLLTWSVKALAELSWDDMLQGLAGVTTLLGGLIVVVKGMSGHTAGMFKAGAGLLILSFGIRNLASAVTSLSGLSWEDMARGLVGVGALLTSLILFTKFAAASKGAIAQGAGLVLLATGIKILASAVGDFGGMSWEQIGKGLASVAAILVAFAGFSHLISPSALVRTGVSLVLVGAAMKILASALGDFGGMSWGEIARGLVSMAGALLAIVLAMNLMPPSTLASAAALVMVSFALGHIATALQDMGGMSWEEIAKGLVTLAGSLIIIAGAMMVMQGALAGAAAIFVVATALRMLAPVLTHFGNMSIGEMAKSLGMLAGVFIIFGLAGLALGPVVPVLLALGAAVALLGFGMLAAGAGVLFFSIALTALAAAGAAGTIALVGMVTALVGLLPYVAEQIGLAVIVFAEVIATAGPAMFGAMSAIMGAIIDAAEENIPRIIDLIATLASQILDKLVELVPKMARAALEIMLAILKALNDKVPDIIREIVTLALAMLKELELAIPQFAKAATDIMVAFLTSVADNLGDVITAGADIIIAVIEGVGENMLRVVKAGMETVVAFVRGLAQAIRDNSEELRSAGKDLASAMISGMTFGLSDQAGKVATEARKAARGALSAAKNALGISSPSKEFRKLGVWSGEGMAEGLERSNRTVGKASSSLGKNAIEAVKESISGMSDLLAVDTDMNPTITPVLNLSEFRKDASLINESLTGQQIDIDMAYSKAKDASSSYRAAQGSKVSSTPEPISAPAEIVYNQYNTSPKALSTAEVYRQTKNQLSRTKGALTP